MDTTDRAEDARSEQDKRIDGRSSFWNALHEALRICREANAQQIWIADATFDEWPLGQRSFVQALSAWVSSRRSFHMLAGDFGPVAPRHPRFVEWRGTWAHVVSCRQPNPEERVEVPTLLYAPDLLCVRIHGPHLRGKLERGGVELRAADEMLDAISQRSTDAFPSTLLGL